VSVVVVSSLHDTNIELVGLGSCEQSVCVYSDILLQIVHEQITSKGRLMVVFGDDGGGSGILLFHRNFSREDEDTTRDP